ncbi:MAG: hypothetical protein JEZ03_08630 [Bacteroidales bacterium]|nr:hypothetical protein [Bacteroidales bacterium]
MHESIYLTLNMDVNIVMKEDIVQIENEHQNIKYGFSTSFILSVLRNKLSV